MFLLLSLKVDHRAHVLLKVTSHTFPLCLQLGKLSLHAGNLLLVRLSFALELRQTALHIGRIKVDKAALND